MASLRLGRAIIFPILLRCLLLALVAAIVGAHFAARSEQTTFYVVLLIYTAIYTLIWCVWLRPFMRFAERRPVLLLGDLLLSFIPAWVSGGWFSPFLIFALGVLILPGMLFGWRGALVATLCYFAADQLVGWTALPPGTSGLFVSPLSALVYLRPILIAAIWPIGVLVWRWWVRRTARTAARSKQSSGYIPMEPRRFAGPATMAPLLPDRTGGSSAVPAMSRGRSNSQTLEHPPALALYALIRQVITEAEEQGLKIQLTLAHEEPILPPGHVQLLTKVVEVGLDNIRCHAHTCTAEVVIADYLFPSGKGISLEIRDHGTGFLDGNADLPGFHQLRRLRYRLLEIEGTLDIREMEGNGVVLTARIPYH